MTDVARILRHKHESLASGGVLTLEMGRDSVTLSDVGGQARRKHWLALHRGTRPLSVVRAEEIEALRGWAADRRVAVD